MFTFLEILIEKRLKVMQINGLYDATYCVDGCMIFDRTKEELESGIFKYFPHKDKIVKLVLEIKGRIL